MRPSNTPPVHRALLHAATQSGEEATLRDPVAVADAPLAQGRGAPCSTARQPYNQRHEPSMTITDYRNFDLLITRAGERYRAFVVDAPAGEDSVVFDLPFALDARPRLGGFGLVRGMSRHLGAADDTGSATSLIDVGSRLFEAVFQDNVQTLLAASLSSVAQEGAGLRLRLRFEKDAAGLATLPWETLYDPTQGHFVGLGEQSPILRYLSLPRSRSALLVEPPLRVLAVLSSPADLPPLNMEREWQAIQDALAGLTADGKFVLERLATPSLAALQDRLLGEPVHILHFVGHGVFDESSQAGSLALEDVRGRSHLVRGEQLATLLRNHPAMRLAYLNACEGALASGQSVFTGVAQTLVREGLPAAVAMQAEITDNGAIELARTFYTALAAGRPVDAALTQARVALSVAGSSEWAIPVLFSRSPDNRLFDIRQVLPTPDCPYPGMVPFSEAQKGLFFGRDKEIEDAVERLRQHPFLAVMGPSGSGKSSLIYAGVIPALRTSRRFGPGEWAIRIMRPGPKPQAALAEALGAATDPLPTLPPPTLPPPRGEPEGGCTLLFVDQFEETFTLAEAGEAQAFLDALQSLIGRPNLHILLTVRADFYPELMASSLWQPIRANRLELTPLGDDELWAAIVEPAARVGVEVDEALAVKLIADASGQKGVLPLVQETLVLLWDRVTRRQLSLAAYRGMADGARSGLQVAIDRRASLVYDNLPEAAQPIARRIFLRLIQFGEGRVDTRRQQNVAELRASGDDPALFDQTLAKLTESRLLTASGDAEGGERRVDIAHEALIAGWPRLQAWLSERRAAEQTRRRLEAKAAEWVAAEKRGGLLDEYELQEAEQWLAEEDAGELGYSQALVDLLQVSKEAIAQVVAEKEAQRQRDLAQALRLAEEQRKLAETERRSANRLRVFLGIGAVLLALAMIAGVVALIQRNKTQEALDVSSRQAIAGAVPFELARGEDRRAMLKALKAVYPPSNAEQMPEMVSNGVRKAVAESPVLRVDDLGVRIEEVAWSPDGKSIFVGSYDGTGLIWSIAGSNTQIMPGRLTGAITAASWSSNSHRILVGNETGNAGIWNLRDGSFLGLPGQIGAIRTVAWSPNGALAATAGEDGVLRLWDTSGRLVAELANSMTPISALAWISDTQIAASERTGVIWLWDVQRRISVGEIISGLKMIDSLAWHQQTQQLLLVGNEVLVWNLENHEEVGRLAYKDIVPESGAWYPDGTRIILFGWWGKALTWRAWMSESTRERLPDGREIIRSREKAIPVWDTNDITVHRSEYGWGPSRTSALSPTGNAFATGGGDGMLVLWATGDETIREFGGHFSVTADVQWHPDGQHFLTVDEVGTTRIWDLTSGAVVAEMSQSFSDNPYDTVSWSPTGDRLLAPFAAFMCSNYGANGQCTDKQQRLRVKDVSALPAGCDGFCLVVWDWTQDRMVAAKPLEDSVGQAVWAPDGQEILVGVSLSTNTGLTAADSPSQLLRWTLSDNALTEIGRHDKAVRVLEYSPNGTKALVAYHGGDELIWDRATNAWAPLDYPETDTVSAAAWLNDEKVLLGGDAGAVYLWDGQTWTKIVDEGEHLGVEVTSIVKRPDAPEILTTSRDGTTRVWRTDTWELTDILFNPDRDPNGFQNEVFEASWSPSGGHVFNATFDQIARLWIGRKALAARLTERVCSTMDEGDIAAEIPEWRGCKTELAAIAENLAEYERLMGEKQTD